jgi:hypothetical protein
MALAYLPSVFFDVLQSNVCSALSIRSRSHPGNRDKRTRSIAAAWPNLGKNNLENHTGKILEKKYIKGT